MGDDKDNQEGIGFSGISSLLPDDPTDVPAQQPISEAGEGGTRPNIASRSTATGTTSPQPSRSPDVPKPPDLPSQQSAPRTRGGGAIWAWIGGIGAVILVIWAASQSGTQPASQSAYQAPAAQTDSSTQPPSPVEDDKTNATATTQPVKPDLQAPPVGSGNVFSVAEIRYCLALKQRVKGAQPVVDTYDREQVDRFNAMVDDYNGRCHDFRYHTGDLEQAERDVAPFSKQLQAQGRQVVQGGTAGQLADAPIDAGKPSKEAILYVQRALKALGYKLGAPDGVMGGETRAAIKQFQRDKYLPADGLVTDSLIDHLRAAEIVTARPQRDLPTFTGNSTKAAIKTAVVSSSKEASALRLIRAQMVGSCNPTYPTDAARSAQVGTTILTVRVGTDGGVTAVDVASSSGSASLDRAAEDALEQCHFTPARRGGEPVTDELRIPVSFNFERRTEGSRTW